MNNSIIKLGKSFISKSNVILILIVEILFFALVVNNFLSIGNVLSVGRQISFIGITGIGMTMVMLTGGIDISIGALMACTGVICTMMAFRAGVPPVIAILAVLALGIFFGTLTGTIISYLKVPALIATLGMQSFYKGISYLLTLGTPVTGMTDDFKYLGQGYVFNLIPLPLIVTIVLFIIGWWFLTKTFIGRRIYAVGGNEEAARMAGINTRLLVMTTYSISGLLSAIAGVLMAARLGSGQPSAGSELPMDVLTATVIGGISVAGGKGSIINVFFGAFIMGFLGNGMVMMGLNEYWQWIIKGVVLCAVVAINKIGSK